MKKCLLCITSVGLPLLALLAAALAADPQGNPLPGAIFTTLSDGSAVNHNIYAAKCDVYLDGGPGPNAPQGAAGLPNGDYFFQVTDPSGKVLLSTDPVINRQFRVEGGIIVGLSGAGNHVTGMDIDHGAVTIQLCPFSDTPNPGGVYKVWATRTVDFVGDPNLVDSGQQPGNFHGFIPRTSKVDNFKAPPGEAVPPPEVPPVDPCLTMKAFRDVDGDGYWDNMPDRIEETDTNAIELGVKFRSDVDGFITGIRFYKGLNNSGTHIGNLWTSTGTLLASATFINETDSGWQQVDFAFPVPIAANTTYVASYHTSVGRYAVSDAYFVGDGVHTPPLHALADGEDGGNGVFTYGPSGFPTGTWIASNYWVDVVFTTDGSTFSKIFRDPEPELNVVVSVYDPNGAQINGPLGTPVTLCELLEGFEYQVVPSISPDSRLSGYRLDGEPLLLDDHAHVLMGSVDRTLYIGVVVF